jgi:hypothetical protein
LKRRLCDCSEEVFDESAKVGLPMQEGKQGDQMSLRKKFPKK